jgi:hypothetical protein
MARRCADLTPRLMPIAEFDFDDDWRRLAKKYLHERHPGSPFTLDRFTRQLRTQLTTHVLALTTADGRPAALAAIYLESGSLYYAAAVYDVNRLSSSLGGHVMVSALGQAKRALCDFAYLGTCYSFGALYKTRFTGMQFFNGRRWSTDRSELTFLLEHQDQLRDTHLLAYPPYVAAFPETADEPILRLDGS